MAASSEDSSLLQALVNITKAEEECSELELVMKPYANWEEYLVLGPLSIAILGELACTAALQSDFPINKKPPADGFKYLAYPESFRACLLQVSDKGWEAFSTAHKNMDGIRLLSMSIPGKIKSVLQILLQEVSVVNALLPGQLRNIRSIADECASSAQAVESKFDGVICLIQELLSACLTSETGYEDELKNTKSELKKMELKQQAAVAAKDEAENYHRNITQKVDQAYADYRNAVRNVPEGWQAIAMSLVEGITENMFAYSQVILGIGSLLERNKSVEADSKTKDDAITLGCICSQSSQLRCLQLGLKELIDEEDNINADDLYNEKGWENKVSWSINNLKPLLENISKENCSLKELAQEACVCITEVSEMLHEITTGNHKKINKEKLKAKMKTLWENVSHFTRKSKECTGAAASVPTAPNIARCQTSFPAEIVIRNVILKVEKSQEFLKMIQEEHQKSLGNVKQQNEKLTDILTEMRKFEAKEIDFDRAREVLCKGLDALGRMKGQWEKVVRFFQMISTLIESCLRCLIGEFVGTMESAQTIANYSHKDFVIDLIYQQAFSASNVAHLVHMISETYTEVSSKYLMDGISSLGRLITMEASNPLFEEERKTFAHGCDEAQKAIGDLVKKKKDKFESNRVKSAKVKKISSELEAALPELSQQMRKATEDNMQKWVRDLTPEENNMKSCISPEREIPLSQSQVNPFFSLFSKFQKILTVILGTFITKKQNTK